jgi:LCP family protein required for cell wall assembly
MSQPTPQDEHGRATPGRAPRRSRGRVIRWLAVASAVCLVLVSVTAYLKFRSVWDSIDRIRLGGLGPQPTKFTDATNILLIGSDSRAGSNRRFGAGVTGQRSDTIIILHIAPGNQGVVALSLPRDSVVPVLACPAADGTAGQQSQPGQFEQINATFANGGPGCLWETIEQTTHLHLDHFIELNFTGFEKVIDDVGGVSICLPFPVNDPLSGLHLSAGRHHVMGAQALAFWRARYIGDGSDLQRINRDQYLMASVLQGVEHAELLSNPARVISVLTDAARSMTTDAGLSLPSLLGIADSLRELPDRKVQFVELPTVPYPADPDWVQWPASDAAVFSALAHDLALPGTPRPASTPASARQAAATGGAHNGTAAAGPVSSSSPAPAGAAEPAATPGGTPSAAPAASPGSSAGGSSGITGSTNVCHDGAAFAGPRGNS